jgi:hypothetical protein
MFNSKYTNITNKKGKDIPGILIKSYIYFKAGFLVISKPEIIDLAKFSSQLIYTLLNY